MPPAPLIRPTRAHEAGFSLAELMVSIAILSIVVSTVMSGVLNLTKVNGMISNRTEMHAGVRNATELLQQEVGQAGRISFPAVLSLGAAVVAGPATVAITSNPTSSGVSGLFQNEQIVVGAGDTEETVTITGVNTTTKEITATFKYAHAAGTSLNVYGGFQAGVVPTSVTNGSSETKLKIFGDINGTGQMKYVEYWCDTAGGNLYRRSTAFDLTTQDGISAEQSLLNNITSNPDGTPCFKYQTQTANNVPYVVDVAITLTVKTAEKDPITGLYQTETKALLNVSPRNVFNVWQLAGLNIMNRVQPMPASITALLAAP